MTAGPDRELRVDPDVGIPDLIRRLADDSKRLARDEIQLAKLELAENTHAGMRGALWLAVAFGVGVLALVALSVLLVGAIGAAARGHYWLGAVVTGILELGLAVWMIKRGLATYGRPSYTLEATRSELRHTAAWAKHPRGD